MNKFWEDHWYLFALHLILEGIRCNNSVSINEGARLLLTGIDSEIDIREDEQEIGQVMLLKHDELIDKIWYD